MAFGDSSCFESSGRRKYLSKLIDKAQLARGYSDCFGHALVLRGAVDAMVDPVVSLWDIAPVACLAKEAGAVYFNFDGEEKIDTNNFICCAPNLKKELLNL